MKVIFVSSEIVPFASTGGLGDVLAALPRALMEQGVEVIRFLPLYQSIDREKFGIGPCDFDIHIPLGSSWFQGTVWKNEWQGVTTFFIQSNAFFERPGIYGAPNHGYGDNFERFLFFQKAVVRLIDEWELKPDIVHCNDWQAGLVPMLLYHGIDGNFRNGREKTLMTIHNLAHQGWAPAEKFYMTQLPDSCYTMETLEFYGEINSLKGGLVGASAINAVSPTYAKEVKTAEFGCKLNGVLYHRQDVLHGILNGIDYERWNPETDTHIPANYSAKDLSGKAECKAALQKVCGFRVNPDVPLLGMISRMVPQKGIDLLFDSIKPIVESGAQLVILGTGDEHYESACRNWADRWPENVCAWIEFSNTKAHRIEAGADLFLMPSEFEPCGQNQLYSMRYGTIPVVRSVGGLEDSVTDYSDKGGTGFKFSEFSAEAFFQCLERALKIYKNPNRWKTLMKRAMRQDFSVTHMANDYIALYRKIIGN
ncbi:glycogen synthase GlgA [Pontiella agarivorans]|uniref:Glycogen synthase n=1 Tax=Pontiella agarivorans TaxID=3038953 RepID=A0ABU5N292_9BACT|nr:glycogen synthase GlgA [Pontiella agarivorans]MDZ8120371.1 glycogen synthase GlgA [Pontiella agarivorans]